MLPPDRFFDPDPMVRGIARELYRNVADLPIVCPHGHVDPSILADNRPFPDPTELIIIPDHYVFRMLYSQGVPLEALGIPRADGGPVETDHRKIWQTFADHFHLFRGTPTRSWLEHEFVEVFGVETPLRSETAMDVYDAIAGKLALPEFRPREMFERFRIEVLATTDAATDDLSHHRRIRESGWRGDVRPTFRPDAAIDLLAPGWRGEVARLGELSGRDIGSFRDFVGALEARRQAFLSLGATASDHAVLVPRTEQLAEGEVEAIFQRALAGRVSGEDAEAFTAHMLVEFARMSVEDGLVMQLHAGSYRNHNEPIFERFGRDKGCDIPTATEFTRNLRPLLNKFGNDPRFTLVVFTLDEATYSRELAPLAGHYPAVRLGPAWWFQDSREGMLRFRQMVTETAGFYNTAGFNDDTRAFPSIPARHDLSRRIDANFLARLVSEYVIDEEEAAELIGELAGNLARRTYKFDRRG